MRILQILILLTFPIMLSAQFNAGKMKVSNYGSFYRISTDVLPYSNKWPYPDSSSLKVIIFCPKTMATDVRFIPTTGYLDYRLGDYNYIATTTIWWRNGKKVGQTCQQTLCGFYLNPIECWERI